MRICPLYEHPELIQTAARWAFSYWYAGSGILLSAVVADYHKRSDFSSLPVTWLALNDTIPVGMVSLKEYDLTSHRHLSPWLSALFVEPSYRNRGIAEALINTTVRYASQIGYNSVTLFTDSRKGDYLLKYYSLRGWTLADRALDKNGAPTNIMTYSIQKSPIPSLNRTLF